MGLLGQMNASAGKGPAPIQTASASTEVAKPVTQAPGQATLIAKLCQPQQEYEVKGQKCRFLTIMDMGGEKFASFAPVAGGPPILAGLDEPVTSLAAPLIKPADAPPSNPAAALAAQQQAKSEPVAEGIAVTACVLGDKYELDGQIAEFTGTSAAGGGLAFFQTTAGSVKLPLTAKVKPLKGAPLVASSPPAETVTAQGSTTSPTPLPGAGESTQGAAQGSEAPKGEGSPPAAEEKPAKKKRGQHKVDDKSETPDEVLQAEREKSKALTQPAAAPTGAALVNALAAQTHSIDGTVYGPLDGVKLYFGCSPVGIAAQHLGPYVDQIERQIITKCQLNICDLRVAQDQTFGFNKWKGFLAEVCRETPPPPGHYVMIGYADERVALVAETLAARIASIHPGNVVKAG